ncbi:YceI family protein [Micrococcus sp.]|uniref:YceI family protein n=1 Tax=Micrococcus sp. TaxID=1271 RepID=UPI0026DB65C0|nr:YceI family protein [Micrococcus sp.]MDO4240445.1 YceI family protein [Micrococcus sp.]
MTQVTPGTWNLDASHTEVGFTVRHAGISKVRGTFQAVSGTLTVAEDFARSSADITVDMQSIDTKDANRDGHLKGEDFFDVEKHPTMTFRSTEVRDFDGEEFVLVGDLTILETTKQVELKVELGGQTTDPFGTTRVGFEAKTEISRKDFGLTWNAALEAGGVLVGDKVKIEIDAEFVQA